MEFKYKPTGRESLDYGSIHSRKYKPSAVSPYLNEYDDDGRCIKRHSDVYLLLRQKRLQETIGVDQIRQYINSLYTPTQANMPDMSDEELLELIPPKGVDNLTTAYQYAKYIQKHQDEIKEQYKAKVKEKQYYEKALKRFFKEDKDS